MYDPDLDPGVTSYPVSTLVRDPDVWLKTATAASLCFIPFHQSLSNGWQVVLEGTKAIPNSSRYCDVRDVARAHILAAEVPGAHGRYLVSHESTVPSKFISDVLQVRAQQVENAQMF